MSTSQNDQTHSHNLSATDDELLSVLDHFVGLALKGLKTEKNLRISYLKNKTKKEKKEALMNCLSKFQRSSIGYVFTNQKIKI